MSTVGTQDLTALICQMACSFVAANELKNGHFVVHIHLSYYRGCVILDTFMVQVRGYFRHKMIDQHQCRVSTKFQFYGTSKVRTGGCVSEEV